MQWGVKVLKNKVDLGLGWCWWRKVIKVGMYFEGRLRSFADGLDMEVDGKRKLNQVMPRTL